MSNVRCGDVFVKREKGLSNSRMSGANNNTVRGSSSGSSLLDKIKK